MKLISIPFLAITGLAAAACGGPPPPVPDDRPPVAVSTMRAEMTELASSFEAGGTIRSKSTAVLTSRVVAPVLEVRVRAGDRVRRGASLVILDSRESSARRAEAVAALAGAGEASRAAEADVRAAEAGLALTRATHDRIRSLQQKRSATDQELDQAVAALDAAGAQLNGARARAAAAAAARSAAQAASDAASITSSYAVLTAPFDGVVTERSVDPGSMASPGLPLLVIEDPAALRLEVNLDEARARHVSVGQTAEIDAGGSAASRGQWIDARVSEISRLDPESHAFQVKVDVAATPALRSGMFGRARFPLATRRVLTIPAAAAIRRGQLTFVYAVDREGRARLQPVSPGVSAKDRLEVLAGLHDGDLVVTNPPASLTGGVRVTGGRQ